MSTRREPPVPAGLRDPARRDPARLLAELNVSQAELAARAGLSTKHVNQIMQGMAPITLETAIVLERITGMPASFWNRREADYREGLLRAKPRVLTAEDETWLASLPIKELQKRGRAPGRKDQADSSTPSCLSSASPTAKRTSGSGGPRSPRSGDRTPSRAARRGRLVAAHRAD